MSDNLKIKYFGDKDYAYVNILRDGKRVLFVECDAEKGVECIGAYAARASKYLPPYTLGADCLAYLESIHWGKVAKQTWTEKITEKLLRG